MPDIAELDRLAAEAGAKAPPPVDIPVDDVQGADLDEQGLKEALAPAIKGFGDIVCRRTGVPELEPEEAGALAGSIARLMSLYNIGPKDPRGAAWMGFGLSVLGIVGPRLRTRPADPEPVSGPVARTVPIDPVLSRGLSDFPPSHAPQGG